MKKILIVDDDKDLLALLNLIISAHVDCHIETTPSGTEAVDYIRTNNYDVVISDYSLNDLNGCDVCKEAVLKDKNTSFVLLSAYNAGEIADLEDLNKLSSNGLFMLKPFENDQLIFIIRHILNDKFFELGVAQYVPVNLALVNEEFSCSDIFFKINEKKMIKIQASQQAHEQERLEDYVSRGATCFWVKEYDFKRVVEKKLELQSLKFIDDDDIKRNTQLPELVHQAIRCLGIDKQVIDISNGLIDNVSKIVKKDKKIWDLLSTILSEKGYINQLAMLTSYISVGVFSNENKDQDLVLQKLVTASLFQDIALSKEYFAKIDAANSDQFKKLSDADKKKVKIHPQEACKVLEQIKGHYFDYDKMVLYHHERPGAPPLCASANLNNLNLYEKIFIMCVDFAQKILKHEEIDQELIEKDFEYVEKTYGQGSFAKAHQHFKTFFKIV